MASHIHNHDISLCYEKKDMMDLTLNMPENSLNKTRYLREHLKYAIVCTLADACQPDIVQLVAMPNTMNEILRDDGVIEGIESPPGYTK
ncbi:hypothetical protein SK128_019006, partial [Halocaridina rubra]